MAQFVAHQPVDPEIQVQTPEIIYQSNDVIIKKDGSASENVQPPQTPKGLNI